MERRIDGNGELIAQDELIPDGKFIVESKEEVCVWRGEEEVEEM